ncbi:MAG: beta-propeller fold lactonase family protein [Acidobacteriia bacterium]|nr:beta-propeller fold lactonase family protein [Terriglobia bacterium]
MNRSLLFRRLFTSLAVTLFIALFSFLFAGCNGGQHPVGDAADGDNAEGELEEGLQGGAHGEGFDPYGYPRNARRETPEDTDAVDADNNGDDPSQDQREPEPTPQAAHAAPSAPRVYFANLNGNAVDVLDTGTYSFIAHVGVGQKPRGVALTPDRRLLFVSNSASASMTVVDAASLQVTATIALPAGSSPYGIAFTPDGASAYVANFITAGSVFVIDVATKTIKANIPASGSTIHVAVSPDGTRAFATNIAGNSLMVIDTLTNTVIATVPLTNADAVATSTNGRWIYVTTDVLADTGKLTILDGVTYAVVQTVPVGNLPVALAASRDGRFLFVANAGSTFVSQFSTRTNTLIRTVPSAQGIQALTYVQR